MFSHTFSCSHPRIALVALSRIDIPDVVACMEDDDPNKDWKFQKALNHDKANLLTHVHFLHINRGLGNFQRFKDFQKALCQVERKSLFNKLQALASGNKYALHDIYGP
jgi:hypothetical protein